MIEPPLFTEDGDPTPDATPWSRALSGTALAATRWTDQQRALVVDAIGRVARDLPEFTADDVWRELNGAVPVTKGLTGCLVRAKGLGLCEQTDRTVVSRRGGKHDHAQRLLVWRSLVVPAVVR